MKKTITLLIIGLCTWSAQAQSDLGRITFSAIGTNNSSISVTMGEAIAGSYLSSDGKTILTIGAQAGNNPIVNPQDSLVLSSYAINVNSSASNAVVIVTANKNWTVNNTASWISVTPASGNTGVANLTINFTANTSTSIRTANIIVNAGTASKTIIVNQSGVPIPSDSLNLSATIIPVEKNQKDTSFNIISNRSWSVTNPANWITVSTLSGTGNATLNLNIAANTINSPRTSTITVTAGSNSKFVTINQSANNVGVNELAIGNEMKIYPNPANSEINVWVNKNVAKNYDVKITDLNGKVILETSSQNENLLIPVSHLASGNYLINVSNKQNQFNKTIKIFKTNN
jgi:hypothetical protein